MADQTPENQIDVTGSDRVISVSPDSVSDEVKNKEDVLKAGEKIAQSQSSATPEQMQSSLSTGPSGDVRAQPAMSDEGIRAAAQRAAEAPQVISDSRRLALGQTRASPAEQLKVTGSVANGPTGSRAGIVADRSRKGQEPINLPAAVAAEAQGVVGQPAPVAGQPASQQGVSGQPAVVVPATDTKPAQRVGSEADQEAGTRLSGQTIKTPYGSLRYVPPRDRPAEESKWDAHMHASAAEEGRAKLANMTKGTPQYNAQNAENARHGALQWTHQGLEVEKNNQQTPSVAADYYSQHAKIINGKLPTDPTLDNQAQAIARQTARDFEAKAKQLTTKQGELDQVTQERAARATHGPIIDAFKTANDAQIKDPLAHGMLTMSVLKPEFDAAQQRMGVPGLERSSDKNVIDTYNQLKAQVDVESGKRLETQFNANMKAFDEANVGNANKAEVIPMRHAKIMSELRAIGADKWANELDDAGNPKPDSKLTPERASLARTYRDTKDEHDAWQSVRADVAKLSATVRDPVKLTEAKEHLMGLLEGKSVSEITKMSATKEANSAFRRASDDYNAWNGEALNFAKDLRNFEKSNKGVAPTQDVINARAEMKKWVEDAKKRAASALTVMDTLRNVGVSAAASAPVLDVTPE